MDAVPSQLLRKAFRSWLFSSSDENVRSVPGSKAQSWTSGLTATIKGVMITILTGGVTISSEGEVALPSVGGCGPLDTGWRLKGRGKNTIEEW